MSKNKKSVWKYLVYFLIQITFIFSLVHYGLYLRDNEKVLESFYLDNGREEFGYKRTVMGAYAGELEGGLRNGFYLMHNTKKMLVFYSEDYMPHQYGEVAVYGYITNEAIYALSVHNYNYNYVLYFISFFSGLFILAFFFREWKMTRRGFENA